MKSLTIKKTELIFLFTIVVIGTFFRLYRISDTVMFLGDQGRDAIIAKNILKEGDIALIGPVTSVGNMYLGPFYYYFMVPWLALSYPNPIGPAVGVALVGVATIPLLYFITKNMFSKNAAYFATSIFTFSSVAISQVRFSWNPNLAPTVGLLIFYFLYKAVKEKKYKYLTWSIIMYAIIIQLHYMAALLAGFIGLVWIYLLYKNKKDRKKIAKNTLIGFVFLFISTIPLFVFNQRHNGIIQKGFSSFFTSSEEHIRPISRIEKIISDINGNAHKLTTQTYGTDSIIEDQIGLVLIIIGLIISYKKTKKSKIDSLNVLTLWFAVSLGAMSLYSSSIFTHYISYTQVVAYILIGVVLSEYSRINKHVKVIAAALSLIIIASNLKTSPSLIKGQSHLKVAKDTSASIYERVNKDEKYNIVLISGTGDIDAQKYRYFLETTDNPPVQKEKRGEVESLYIIQEDYFDTKAIDSPIYEIVVFPDKEPKEVYSINNGPTITVLRKNNE
ncbi:ArnT family glycosyltransferase [Patescibacteria group bacterium]